MEQGHGTWGERIRTYRSDSALVTILYLQPMKRCSWHHHNYTYNQFFVIRGSLGVKTNIGPGDSCQTTWIGPKEYFTVPPGIKHEFRTGPEGAIIEEVAYVKYDESDIHRDKLGGDLDRMTDDAKA